MELRQGKRLSDYSVLFYLLAFALLLRLSIGLFVTNKYDTYWYRQWILDFQNGFFSIYSRADAIALDYPPLFLVLVYPISLLYKIVPPNAYEMADMLFLKLIPILFDIACAFGFFLFGKKEKREEAGFAAALLWALNPSMIFNSSVWGQTDSVMCFLLLVSFWLLYRRQGILGSVLFAAACMVKFQCLFFAPVFCLGILYICFSEAKERKQIALGFIALGKCALAAIATIVLVFLPFSIAGGEPFLFPTIYFESGGKYPYCTLNAFNFFGLLGLNWVKYSAPAIFGLSFAAIGYILTFLGIILLAVAWFISSRKCVFVASLFIMQHIFMFMPAMHERYQVAVLPFCLAAWLVHRRGGFGALFAALSGMTLINQFIVLANAIKSNRLPWAANFDQVMAFFSLINLLLYIISAILCFRFLLGSQEEQQEKEA